MIEGVLFLAASLVFAWWQLRQIRKDQEQTRRARERQADEAGGRDAPEG